MKEIIVVSGKGGTGKTSVTASFAVLAGNAVVADCDVDAADLHLLLEPLVKETHEFSGGKSASIISGKCVGCGKCYELCRFGAVIRGEGDLPYTIDRISCEGCGVCSYFCPAGSINFEPEINGQWFVSETGYGPMVHARLGIAAENSGKLVSVVRKRARDIAIEKGSPYIITDGPPGIGCPVISSITGADAVLIVAEPTVSGEHDIFRVAELAGHFKIPAFLCVNKYDINERKCKEIENKARIKGIICVGRIGYDRDVTRAQIKGVPVVLIEEATAASDITDVWFNIKTILEGME